ncbi:RsmD family RNA methyltransferase [Amnibacterium sp.]|uniref:RsmD family RNA methyltransferase n=1 Tax=Amnibacterium sp. TaxID=1872496 RepID=UPI002609157F|nr:RsmD family RNA methyltransferase [Amnibacterium sp.]MCU1475250.1 rsmD [Amnibacterium sp.]
MPRIISGWAGSLQLRTPPTGTRPTSDRVREALFSALEARDAIRNAHVLDLFAGSGALAFEALSRGAASAVLVDKGNGAAKAMRQNLAQLQRAAPAGVDLDVRVVVRPVAGYLATPTGPAPTLVFLDPPYDLPGGQVTDALSALVRVAAPGALLVLERSVRDRTPAWPDGVALDRTRTYGDTAVHLLETESGS